MKRLTSLIVALAFLLSVAPTFAAPQEVTTLPQPKAFSSARFDFATSLSAVIDGQAITLPTIGGRGVLTAAGIHTAYYDAVENLVFEVIVYGDTIYTRRGNETRWKAARIDTTSPIADTEDLPAGSVKLYRLEEDVAVRGVPTTQYQLQINPSVFPDDSGIKAANLNVFLAKADNALLKEQTTVVATDATVGDVLVQQPVEYYGFDDATNVVNRPPADVVDAAQIDIEFPGSAALKPWARPFVAEQLAELRAR